MGDVFGGRYELIDPLGEGGAGVVWRVWDQRERRFVAAKVLRQVDAHSLLRFMREQSVRIEHPHILTPLGWAGEDDRVLFTMPLIRGGSVATLIGDYGPLPAPWVARLLDQLLQALARIHSRGLVHRDVKPANLLLDATGRADPHLRLSDFGVATGLGEPRLTQAAVVLGTHGYVAPESLAGADPHPAADLFAAGMTAAEMLTGLRPGASSSVAADLFAAGVPEPLARLVIALVAADPRARPVSAEDARRRLLTSGALPALGQVCSAGALGPAGIDIEIFDHVPPVPAGWQPRDARSPARRVGRLAADPGKSRARRLALSVGAMGAGAVILVVALVLALT